MVLDMVDTGEEADKEGRYRMKEIVKKEQKSRQKNLLSVNEITKIDLGIEKPGIEMEEITTVRATKRMVSALKNLKIMISRKLKTGMKTLQTTIPFQFRIKVVGMMKFRFKARTLGNKMQ